MRAFHAPQRAARSSGRCGRLPGRSAARRAAVLPDDRAHSARRGSGPSSRTSQADALAPAAGRHRRRFAPPDTERGRDAGCDALAGVVAWTTLPPALAPIVPASSLSRPRVERTAPLQRRRGSPGWRERRLQRRSRRAGRSVGWRRRGARVAASAGTPDPAGASRRPGLRARSARGSPARREVDGLASGGLKHRRPGRRQRRRAAPTAGRPAPPADRGRPVQACSRRRAVGRAHGGQRGGAKGGEAGAAALRSGSRPFCLAGRRRSASSAFPSRSRLEVAGPARPRLPAPPRPPAPAHRAAPVRKCTLAPQTGAAASYRRCMPRENAAVSRLTARPALRRRLPSSPDQPGTGSRDAHGKTRRGPGVQQLTPPARAGGAHADRLRGAQCPDRPRLRRGRRLLRLGRDPSDLARLLGGSAAVLGVVGPRCPAGSCRWASTPPAWPATSSATPGATSWKRARRRCRSAPW